MKIKYNLEYNFFNIYDELQGIASSKQLLYRDEHRTISRYTESGFKFIKYAIIESIIMIIFNILPLPNILTDIINFIFAITVGGIVAYYVIFLTLYNNEKNRSHKGELLINEEGILDISDDGVKLGIPWHYIECVIITDNIICFVSKVMGYITLTVEHYSEVIKALDQYQNDLKVIDKRTIRRETKEEIVEDHPKEEKIENVENLEELEPIKEDSKEKSEEQSKKSRKKKNEEKERSIEDVEQAIKELTED